MDLENYFISQFTSKMIGDDGAFLEGFVYSKDAFFENVHFKMAWMDHYQIAQKAMMVNISDAIAMNAKPLYALLSVAMPKSITKQQMRDLARGFEDAAKQFGIEIIGGDTLSNVKLDITVTIISKSTQPLLRSTAKIGDVFAFTGKLGRSKKDLQKLLNGASLHKKSKFFDIQLRDRFVLKASKHLSAGMDISDGLMGDLAKMCSSSKLGYRLLHKIDKYVNCSGEEYEMLVAVSKRKLLHLKRIAKQTRTPLQFFAIASRNNAKNICKSNHF